MKFIKSLIAALLLVSLVQLVPSALGFALLGPIAPWMQETNGVYVYDPVYDIGGPMDIGSGYRWNTPVITYGFDVSFLNYFGAKGVRAVESAMKVFNDLPSASKIVLTNYPFNSREVNGKAFNHGDFYDLKSQTLSTLLEQLGLAQPGRHIMVLHQSNPVLTNYSTIGLNQVYSLGLTNYIVMRNFDPQTLSATAYVNQNYYIGEFITYRFGTNQTLGISGASDANYVAVAENNGYGANSDYGLGRGEYFSGLTYDDVGGLRYLLNARNVAYEKLLPDTVALNSRAGILTDEAWRPGVEKIIFVRQHASGSPNNFRPLRYRFSDYFYSNNVVMRQLAVRTVYQPDILFSVADNGEGRSTYDIPLDVRSSTAQWQNNAEANGNTNGEGPGVIQPPIKITFHKLGPTVGTAEGMPNMPAYYNGGWGILDKPSNTEYLTPTIKNKRDYPLTIHLFVADSYTRSTITNQSWYLNLPIEGKASLQSSTDQNNWNIVATVTNVGSVVEWIDFRLTNSPKFYRAVPQ